MPVANPYGKLLEDKVMTASKEELTLMLYDGALKFCNQAIFAIEKKDMAKAHALIVRVEDIIREFQINFSIPFSTPRIMIYTVRALYLPSFGGRERAKKRGDIGRGARPYP